MTSPATSIAAQAGGLWIDARELDQASTRSSFVSCRPALWLRGSGSIFEVFPGPEGDRGWLKRVQAADPGPGPSYERLTAISRLLRVPMPTPAEASGLMPPSFRGGFAGAFSYDLGRRFENLEARLPTDLPWDFCLGLYDEVVELTPDGSERHWVLPGASGWLRVLWANPPAPVRTEDLEMAVGTPQLSVEMSPTQHTDRVQAIREQIRTGTIYQANLTYRCHVPWTEPLTPLATFLRLQQANPAPWGMYQQLPDRTIVSSSPEPFLDLSRTGRVRSRPIKGTAARGEGATADRAAAQGLLTSPKDRSELTMIVDLVRNDLGRVCAPGSVNRNPVLELEAHPTVWHLVGEVTGRLAPGRDALDLLKASFPPGSCIGAPKIRAMQVLETLELSRRGVYTGALGWIGFDGAMALSVAIRTLVFAEGVASLGVGGGIVFDSDPQSEWNEAQLKGRALLQALLPGLYEAPQSITTRSTASRDTNQPAGRQAQPHP